MVDLLLTEEERMLQAVVREFADRELKPAPGRWTRRRRSTGRSGVA